MGSPSLHLQAGCAEELLPCSRAGLELLLHNKLGGNSSCSYKVCWVAIRATSSPECAAFLVRALRSLPNGKEPHIFCVNQCSQFVWVFTAPCTD